MTDYFKRSQEEWDLHYLRLAKTYSLMSRDPSTKVGCVAVNSTLNRVLALGYNGFHRGQSDNPDLYNDREYKLENIVHAEDNVMSYLTLTFGERLNWKSISFYVYPFTSCTQCAIDLIEFYKDSVEFSAYSTPPKYKLITTDYVPERWETSFKESTELLIKNGIEVINYPIHKV